MPLNWTTGALMRPAPCLPCCAGTPPTPSECSCALLIPPFLTPYASYSDAATAIADYVADCIMYAVGSGPTQLDNYTVAVGATLDVVLASASVQRGSATFSVSLKAGETVSSAASVSTDGTQPERPAFVSATLFSCDGDTLIDQDIITGSETAASGTAVVTAPDDAEYILVLEGGGAGDATSFSYSSTNTFSDAFTVNPVIALWDDSGTTRKLWACPKLLLPPLTESTGDWYADATAAAAAISGNTSNCVGYIESKTNVTTFTATDGGTSLTLAQVLAVATTSSPVMWGGVNAIGGQTLTVTATAGLGTPGLNVTIYDDTGTLVEASGAVGTPWASSALPYTGRYTVRLATTSTLATVSMAGVITSSGTLSVNQIQARYDIGLTCAATDDC